MQAAPELLLQLRLTPTGEIAISGDPRFFPTFHDVREIDRDRPEIESSRRPHVYH
jgi:hypothetical protein